MLCQSGVGSAWRLLTWAHKRLVLPDSVNLQSRSDKVYSCCKLVQRYEGPLILNDEDTWDVIQDNS